MEKIYVAIGADLSDGFATLKWTLEKWASSASVKIVILYADNNICKDYVDTLIGRIPASSVNEEKLRVLDKSEEAKTEEILSKFVAFCGEVKAEGRRIDRYEEPNHDVILRLITILHITKLVMAFSFLRPPSWKSRNAANASFSLHREKPDFCELFVIHKGKLVTLREENSGGFMDVIVAKLRERPSFKGWIGKKLFAETAIGNKSHPESRSSSSTIPSLDQGEKHIEELDHYFNELSASIEKQGDIEEEENGAIIRLPTELNMAENMGGAEKLEVLKMRIDDTQEAIQSNKRRARANAERYEKAKWAIGLCSSRVDELESRTKEEDSRRMDLQKDLDKMKEELIEIQGEVEEKRSKLNSIIQLQGELSKKLQLSSSAKLRVESQLEKAVRERAEMVEEIEELRKQRDVFQRRIEFCKEKDAIGMAKSLAGSGFDYRKFAATEIRAATDDFAQRLRLKSAGEWTNVYKGRINETTVAVKLSDSVVISEEAFLEKVRLLGSIRHPHVLTMMGFCTELKCIVFEYMHNGCLRDAVFSRRRCSSRGRRNCSLNWHDRIRIAAEICTALSFLHKANPSPLVHGNLNPSRILLDKNNVAKIHGFMSGCFSDENATAADIRAFGTLILQLLTGRNWAGIVEGAIVRDRGKLTEALDKMAGEWPLDLAVELAGIARRCLSKDETKDKEFSTIFLMRLIEKVRKSADDHLMANEASFVAGEWRNTEEHNVPSVFFCPIYQDVMKNPYVAADGFSYELEAIEEWIRTGRDTSPMTNLKLKHKQLTPNHTLRSLIQDWHNKRFIPSQKPSQTT